MHHLKKLIPQGHKRLLRLDELCALYNYEFMIHHVPIYRKHLKDFNKENKNLKYFSFYNLFNAYETKVKRKL